MKTWVMVAGAVAAVGAAAVVTLVRRRSEAAGDEIPRMIADCRKQVDRIERDLRRLRTSNPKGI